MAVMVDGTAKYNWPVSTGAKRYTTPSGVYKPQWLARKWRSKQYHNAPMPHSIFFHNGFAIHGTTEVARLGKEASHGCVRLAPANAATLYALVEKNLAATRIVLSDDTIDKPSDTPKKKPGQFVAEMRPKEVQSPARVIAVTPPVPVKVEAVRAPAAIAKDAAAAPREAPKTKSDPVAADNAINSKPPATEPAPQLVVEPAAPVPAPAALKLASAAPAAPAEKPRAEAVPEQPRIESVPEKPRAERKREPREVRETREVSRPKVASASRSSQPGFHW